MRAAGDQTGEMRHVDHQIGADGIGDRAKPREVDDPRIGAAAGDDEARPMRLGLAFDLGEIDSAVLGAHAVGRGAEPFTRQIRRRAVRQVAAGGERHAEDWVAGRQKREKHRLVRRRPGMRLHIGKAAAEQALGAVDREPLGDIDKTAAAVIAAPGIALGVFVGQHRALRFEDRARDDILACDQLDLVLLALAFAGDRRGQFRVGGGERIAKKAGFVPGRQRERGGDRQDNTSGDRG